MRSPVSRTLFLGGAMLALASLFISLTPRVPLMPIVQAKRQRESVITPSSDATKMRVSEAYGKRPLSFEPNRGQTDRAVKFLSRGQGYTLFLTSTEAMLRLNKSENAGAGEPPTKKTKGEILKPEQAFLRMKMVGANAAAQVSGVNELQGKSNYLIGNDRKKWHTDIPTFSRVRYEDIYKGIDVVFYGTNQRQLEYDFIVEPGADSHAITLSFEGADRISIDERGDLVLET